MLQGVVLNEKGRWRWGGDREGWRISWGKLGEMEKGGGDKEGVKERSREGREGEE